MKKKSSRLSTKNIHTKFAVACFAFVASQYARADAACDAKALAAVKAQWEVYSSFSQMNVVNTTIINQSSTGTQWSKTTQYDVNSTSNNSGSMQITGSGATASTCVLSPVTLIAATGLQNFSRTELISIIETFIPGDMSLGTSTSTACSITYGIKKFLPHEYSQYAVNKAKPNFFYIGVQGVAFQDTQPHYMKFNVDSGNIVVGLTDYSASHLYADAIDLSCNQGTCTSTLEISGSPGNAQVSVNDGISSTTEYCTIAPPPTN